MPEFALPLAAQILFTVFFGFLFGSFGSVLLARIPYSESILGRSHCSACKRTLEWFELIPLFSYIALRGRCRTCAARISLQYPMLEILTAFLFLLVLLLHPARPTLALLPLAFACFVILLIAIHDAKTQSIPDIFTIILAITALLFRTFLGYAVGWQLLFQGLLGASALGGFFATLWLVSRGRWTGSGDIFFAGALGLLLGLQLGIIGLGLAYITGSLFALPLLALGKMTRKDTLPFGPFLAIGAYIALFFGEEILRWLERGGF